MKKSTIFGAYDNFYLYYFVYFIYKFWDKNYFAEFTMKIFYVMHCNTVYKERGTERIIFIKRVGTATLEWYVCVYVCMYVWMFVCMYVHTYVRMYVCVCVCVYV